MSSKRPSSKRLSSKHLSSKYVGVKRRNFLLFLGATAGTSALSSLGCGQSPSSNGSIAGSPTGNSANENSTKKNDNNDSATTAQGASPFEPLKGPMPYGAIQVSNQPQEYAQYVIQDDIVLPEGFLYDVIASWGDPVGDSRFGYNNDYLSFIPTGPDAGYLTINFEYISSSTWEETYELVMGKALPFDKVTAALEPLEDNSVDAFALKEDNPLKAQIITLSREMLTDQGLGVISVRREDSGQWVREPNSQDRRISGISGLEDGRYLQSTGPATAVFIKSQVKGYTDGLGNKIIGTFGNCAGGTTPWGTALSAEENIQNQVPEAVQSDGSSSAPSEKPFSAGFNGQGNVFGLAGNKYGWIVEVDPSNPNDYGTKHTWLGRYRHEAVGVRVQAGKPLAFYSGCDRRGGHVYKFISKGIVSDPTDKANSRLLTNGMLYAAKINPDGTGTWMPLNPETPVNPVLPSQVMGNMVTLPKRPDGGFEKIKDDAKASELKQKFSTLGALYEGTALEKQGAILIDAHFAANAAGATCTARPEDTEVAPDGTLFIAFTSGKSGGDGGPDKAVFVGPNGESDYEAGWIMKLIEDNNDPGALTFTWEMFATGGEPAEGGMGFANPDNLEFDSAGHLWVVTDMSTSTHNKPVPQQRKNEAGKDLTGKDLLGLYGNNSLWQIETQGENAGEAKMFAYGPMECELTGPFFTDDGTALFLSAQHPGERTGTRKGMATETRSFELKTTDGQTFLQTREVPLGSNWPGGTTGAPPRPSVVVIRREQAGTTIV
ncbi:MAG: alkaline phosphatase PhoX [Cyanobacteria bacterium J06649_5]